MSNSIDVNKVAELYVENKETENKVDSDYAEKHIRPLLKAANCDVVPTENGNWRLVVMRDVLVG